MLRLLRSEALRAWSRRLVRMVVAGSVLTVVGGVAIAAVRSRPPTAAERTDAARTEERELDRCLRGDYGVTEETLPPAYGSLRELCDSAVEPSFQRGNIIHRDQLPDILQGTALIVVLLGVVIAGSLGGADWSAGSMTTLLTWESGRIRVLLARGAIAIVTAIAVALLAQGLLTLAWLAATAARGVTTTDDGFAGEVVATILRISLVAGLFGGVAYALANIGRSTVAAIGILLGYLAVIEGFLVSLWIDLVPWLLVRAATAVISQVPIVDPTAQASYGPDGRLLEVGGDGILLSVGGAWLVIAAYVAVLLAAAAGLFKVRDVT